MSIIAKTDDGTGKMCVQCGCLVEQGFESAHKAWHEEQKQTLVHLLRIATHALDTADRLRMKILEMEGNTP